MDHPFCKMRRKIRHLKTTYQSLGFKNFASQKMLLFDLSTGISKPSFELSCSFPTALTPQRLHNFAITRSFSQFQAQTLALIR